MISLENYFRLQNKKFRISFKYFKININLNSQFKNNHK